MDVPEFFETHSDRDSALREDDTINVLVKSHEKLILMVLELQKNLQSLQLEIRVLQSRVESVVFDVGADEDLDRYMQIQKNDMGPEVLLTGAQLMSKMQQFNNRRIRGVNGNNQ